MSEPGNERHRSRRSAARGRWSEKQILDALEDLRRRDRRVHHAYMTIILLGDVKILRAVAVILRWAVRAARRRALRDANHVANVSRSPR